jgi:hypothetical protein
MPNIVTVNKQWFFLMSYFNNYYVMETKSSKSSNAPGNNNVTSGKSDTINSNGVSDNGNVAILAKFASGAPLTDDELTTIGKIFAAQKQVMQKAKQYATKQATAAEKAAQYAQQLQAHKLTINDMVNNLAAKILNESFADSKAVKTYLQAFAKTLPHVPTMGKGRNSSGNSRKPITDVNNLTENSSNYIIWHAIKAAGTKGINRKGLIAILAKAQPTRKLTLVKQAVSIGCNTLPVKCENNMYTIR